MFLLLNSNISFCHCSSVLDHLNIAIQNWVQGTKVMFVTRCRSKKKKKELVSKGLDPEYQRKTFYLSFQVEKVLKKKIKFFMSEKYIVL